MKRYKNEDGVIVWREVDRVYAGCYVEFEEAATVAEIRSGAEDCTLKARNAIRDLYDKEPDGGEVILKVLPDAAKRKSDPTEREKDPLCEEKVSMTAGYKAWKQLEGRPWTK